MSSPSPLIAVSAIKKLDAAKSRLRASSPLMLNKVAELVLAMLTDTVAAISPLVAGHIVVTDDPIVTSYARSRGLIAVPEPAPSAHNLAPDGLNQALSEGIHAAHTQFPTAGIIIVQPDLPAISANDIALLATKIPAHSVGFVADHNGSGTTILTIPPSLLDFPLQCGPRSAYLHAASGAVEIIGPWYGLHRDVDTVADLELVVPLLAPHSLTRQLCQNS